MIRFLTSCCVACVALTSVAQAQFFGFGPWGGVRVRAPFVAVDVSPYGGTRVIAPFTHVDTRYYGPVYGPVVPVPPVPAYPVPVPVYPSPVYPDVVYPSAQPGDYQVARPALTGSVPEQLRASAERLARSLSMRRDDADVWLRYLDPQRIIEVIDRGESPESLRGLVANYDGVVGNAGLVSISRASGFAETRQWLRQFVGGQRQPSAPAAASDPAAAPDDRADGPTPAPPIQPAVKEKQQAEELPVPPPPEPPAPAPPETTSI